MIGRFSHEFRSFVGACLQKDPDLRPNTQDLLKHPFIVKHASKFFGIHTGGDGDQIKFGNDDLSLML